MSLNAGMRWCITVIICGLVVATNLALQPLTGGRVPFAIFYPALVIIGVAAGVGPSFIALAIFGTAASVFWVLPVDHIGQLSLATFFLTGAAVAGIASFARVVMKRDRDLRAALAESEERVRLAVDGAQIGLWSTDLQTGITYHSELNERIFGIESGARLGVKKWRSQIHPEDRERVQEAWNQSIAQSIPYSIEYRIQRQNGVERWVGSIGRFYKGTARQNDRLMGISIDITERKQVELALEDAYRQKDEFIATLAHELRNPMAPIRYAAELIRPETNWAILKNVRDIIERQSHHMSRLLDDLLDMSRITRNIIELRLEELDVRPLLQSSVNDACQAIEMQRHSVIVSVPEQPVIVKGDAVRIVQIIENLLHNAIKYTPAGGSINLNLSTSENEVILSISDSGIGLSSEMLPEVFRLFSQAHKAMKVSASGLGIGLSIAKRLVELHGGTIAAHSEGQGHGSTFVVSLPRAAVASTPAPSIESDVASPSFSNVCTLVIDDNRDAADSLILLLKTYQLAAHVAYDGESALSIANILRPDVVILDLGLPDISGEQVATEIRKLDWASTIKIIAVTGWGQAADRQRTADAGFDGHLVKPVDPKELLAIIHAFGNAVPSSISEPIKSVPVEPPLT